ncbi:MAG: DegQ family serine endoprotease [Thalassolituus sp.]|uniref:DegQ family serine endoprotease n=1 Tax=Thalassolituus sp. TaxID=2030822 RepID=UPI000B7162E6|nr:DegQ family serine endoprotease [Thalassolituus sp.]MDQ4423086.1 DegQ family serine endoprotease [Thalassolituus sp.]MDQ4427285.1 DegQ family serine endoprotease [Thalassolituus sp.]OUX65308.1 MAG: serine peptidase [Oceanospirillaceae bacterium TMED276]
MTLAMKRSLSLLTFLLAVSWTTAHADLPDFRDLVKESSPAVVNISTVQHAQQNSALSGQYGMPDDMPEIFRHFFGRQFPQGPAPRRDSNSLGSGFIVSDDGYILTNNHVVQDADEIIVRLNDRRELEAVLIGADPSSDLAVLKVDADDLPTVELGDSDKLDVGEWVVAIGSPFGFDYSVTAGIVSAKGRSLPNENYVPFIQTDVAINPGNSGGPLFNLDGQVVGINSQIYTRSGGFMGVSFAIPINVAMDVAEQLKSKGKVSRGWLGVVIQEVNKDLAESFGLDRAAGALVVQVVDGSPAEASGLVSGDIIVKVNGKAVQLSSDLPHLIGRLRAGDTAKLSVVRAGKRKTIDVEIGALPESDEIQLSSNTPPAERKSNRLGLVVSDIPAGKSAEQGVVVTDVNRGPASMSGVIRGDVITMINGQRISSVADFERVVKDLPGKRSVPMRIVRRGQASFIPLRID